ncbi:MAG TPA: acyltransferase [Stellaceae bacterium]|nr:acyltransferase [Stellaceae bacterium]
MSDRANPPANNHFAALDSLRGLAAASVVLFHVRLLAGPAGPLFALGYVRNAYLMVDFFFVLSGFVIALNYAERIPDARAAARFVWLRFWRLYPLHLAFLFVLLAIEGVKWLAERRFGIALGGVAFATNDAWAFATNLLLAQSFGLTPQLTFNIPAWSIGAEFYTYLAFALVALATRRVMTVAAVIVAAGAMVLVLVSPDGLFLMQDGGFIRCLFGFFLGVIGCGVYRRLAARSVAASMAACLASLALVAALALLAWKPAPFFDFAIPPLAAVVVVALALAPGTRLSRVLSARPLAWLGRVSYSIYMTHWAVLLVATNLLLKLHFARAFGSGMPADIVLTLLCLAPVLLLSQWTFRHIETPWRDWSRRAGWQAVREAAPSPAQ